MEVQFVRKLAGFASGDLPGDNSDAGVVRLFTLVMVMAMVV